jgi:dimethylargininase
MAIDQDIAARQHAAYCQALGDCGCEVRTLELYRHLPDCAFIEDTAIVLDEVAVLASMGAGSRRDEPARIEPILGEYREIKRIPDSATLEGGDVLRAGRTLLVGQSGRTNAEGIGALAVIAKHYGYRVIGVAVRGCLHLKTACSLLPDGRLLVQPAWIDVAALDGFELVHVPDAEPWGANVATVGEFVLASAANVRTADLLRAHSFAVRNVDLSEFGKAEGGVTCLSLLIP